MSRNLGVDYGSKRVGIAVTDPLNIVASGLATLSPKQALIFIVEYCFDHNVESIVVGKPTHVDGKPTAIFEQIKSFSTKLSKQLPKVKIIFHEEFGTSKMASQIMIKAKVSKKKRREKGVLDQMSARLILSDYLGIASYPDII